MKLKRFEKRVKGAFAQSHLFAYLGDFEFRRLIVKEVEDLQSTFNRLNYRHNFYHSRELSACDRTIFTGEKQWRGKKGARRALTPGPGYQNDGSVPIFPCRRLAGRSPPAGEDRLTQLIDYPVVRGHC
jgi:hypothetical protein